MEYDRALYRVYERVMEDLSSSPPLIPPRRRDRYHHQDQSQSAASSANAGSSSIQGITVANSNEHQQQQQVATESSAASRSPSNETDNTPQIPMDNIRATPSHHPHHTAEKVPIPFFLPLCLAPYGDALLDAVHTREWNRIWHTICYHASIHYHECTTAFLSFRAACFHRYCSRTSRRHVTGGSYMDVNHNNYDDRSPPPSQHGSSIEFTNRSTVMPPHQTAFLNGLRLRHRTATAAGDSSHSNSSSGTNNTDNYSTTLNNDDDEDDDLLVTGGNFDGNSVIQSDVSQSSPLGSRRFARQVALLQHQRSSNNINDSTNSREDDDRGGCTQKGVYALGRISLFLALWHLIVLYCLHCTYVGGENIIKEYEDYEVEYSHQKGMNGDKFKRRKVLEGSDGNLQDGIKKRTCIEYALATRPTHLRSQYFHMYGDDDDKEDEDNKTSKEGNANENENGVGSDKDQQIKNVSGDVKGDEQQEIELPLLGKDEILQIKILYGGKCTGQCSRVHTVLAPSHNGTVINDGTDNDDDDPNLRFRRNLVNTFSPQQMGYWTQYDNVWNRIRSLSSVLSVSALPSDNQSKNSRYGIEHVQRSLTDMLKLNNITSNNGDGVGDDDANVSIDPFSTAKYWEEPHYIFSTNEALLYLDKNIRSFHNITLVNITVTEQCLATGTDQVTDLKNSPSTRTRFAQIMSQIYGMDTIIINQLMYGIKTVKGKYRNGHVQNLETKERWTWTYGLLEQHNTTRGNSMAGNSIDSTILLIAHKISLLVLSILSFFLITSVTALIVRVLTSSGVVMMFPLFAMFRSFGMVGADDRILGFSYPWIGRARRAIAREGVHPQEHLIASHLAKMFLYYVMYEACQAVWSSVLYFKSIPSSLPLWIYGFAMILEYFSMVFVRSALSAYFFPRITLLYFVWYHLYFYSVPYGFFDVALIPWFLLMVHAMTFTVIALEVPAASRGAVSLECPREVYNRLSWHEWNASLPHEWTIFLPLNSRYIPLHDRDMVENDVGSGSDNDTVEEDEPSGHEREDNGTTESVGSNDDDGTRSMNTNGDDDRSLPLGSNDILTSGRDGLHERRIPRMP